MNPDITETRLLMERCGLSTRGCARLLGVSFEVMRNIMYGKRQPTPDMLKKLRKLENSVSKIFC